MKKPIAIILLGLVPLLIQATASHALSVGKGTDLSLFFLNHRNKHVPSSPSDRRCHGSPPISYTDNFTQCSVHALNVSGGASESPNLSSLTTWKTIVNKNSFLVSMAAAVAFARVFPSLGVNGGIMRPELFIGKFGVTLIFLLSGLSLELNELKSAVANMKLNFLVQAGSFLAWPFLVGVPLIAILKRIIPNFLPNALLEGLLILTCLPTTVNMCVLLTASAGGNVAASLANAVMGNMLGIFVTPALLMYFFGTAIELPFLQMVLKLINKVLVPVAVGQLLRATQAKDFFVSHKKTFKSLQEVRLCHSFRYCYLIYILFKSI
jgi:hypothetical protein